METVVKPNTLWLSLCDVARRAREELIKTNKAKDEELAAADDRLAAALVDDYKIEVKRRLNTGEQQDLFAVMSPEITPGERTKLKTNTTLTAKVLAYLVGWNITDEGSPIVISPRYAADDQRLSAIRSIDPDIFRDIREAIDFHETAIEKEIAASKKTRGGLSVSDPTSTSPVGVTGATSG